MTKTTYIVPGALGVCKATKARTHAFVGTVAATGVAKVLSFHTSKTLAEIELDKYRVELLAHGYYNALKVREVAQA